MKEEIIIAGFGGQGVLSMGKILAYSGIMQGQEVTWMPSYGLSNFDTAIILNQQSMDKFEEQVKPGGLLIYDPNGITRHPQRKDITVCSIDAVDISAELGNSKAYNMVVLGAYLSKKKVVEHENVIKGLKKSLPERHHNLIPMNEKAIQVGMNKIVVLNTM
jgi:2-oxoglutarate ferredoxin oxidoreductase subunit gamma